MLRMHASCVAQVLRSQVFDELTSRRSEPVRGLGEVQKYLGIMGMWRDWRMIAAGIHL